MAFLKTRTVKGIGYYYASEGKSINGNEKQGDVYYFGNRKPDKHEWEAVLAALEGKDEYVPKEEGMAREQKARIDEISKKMKSEFGEMSKSELENFNEKFSNDYIYNTNSIEGSTMTPEETYIVTREGMGVSGRKLKEIYMARNLADALKFLGSCKEAVSIPLAKKLHACVQENIQPTDEMGEFKRRQNYIIGAEFLPTPPKFVQGRMEGLMRWRGRNEKAYHPFELSAIFHVKFVSIHPFIDGNGRVARLLHNYILQRHKIVPMVFRTQTKQKYYAALRAAQSGAGHRQFLDYCMEEFAATYEIA